MSMELIGTELNRSVDLWMATNDPARSQPFATMPGEIVVPVVERERRPR